MEKSRAEKGGFFNVQIMLNKYHNTPKVYSKNSIIAATTFGGPIVAGVLLQKNFINLGKERLGLYTLLMSLFYTLILISGLLMLPSDPLDNRILNFIFPLFHGGLVYIIVDKYMLKELNDHISKGGEMYSGWNVAGVALIGAILTIGVAILFAFITEPDIDFDQFNERMEEFYMNETHALEVYDSMETKSGERIINELDSISIPKFLTNLQILDELDELENLPDDLLKQNDLLREYCQLRLQDMRLVKLSIEEDTDEYNGRILLIQEDIEKLLIEFRELQENSDYFL